MAGYAPVAPISLRKILINTSGYRESRSAAERIDLADYRFRITPGAGEVLHDDVDSRSRPSVWPRLRPVHNYQGGQTRQGEWNSHHRWRCCFSCARDKTPGFGHAFSTQPELLKQVDSPPHPGQVDALPDGGKSEHVPASPGPRPPARQCCYDHPQSPRQAMRCMIFTTWPWATVNGSLHRDNAFPPWSRR